MKKLNRIVVKIGTKVLSRDDGKLDEEFLKNFVQQIVELRQKNIQIVIVTSGAVGAGKSIIFNEFQKNSATSEQLQNIKSETVKKQIFAAIGQVKLMNLYAELFKEHNYYCAQVLATKEDFRDNSHYENMKNCFDGLLLDNVIPIVNENDVVAITELLFTDNDELAGLVATQLKSDALIIMTATDGILNDQLKTVPIVNSGNIAEVSKFIKQDKTNVGRGGMISKFATAIKLAENGIITHIVDGKTQNILISVCSGEQVGTKFE